MSKRIDYLAVITMVLLCATSLGGILSINFSHTYEVMNQYGDIISMYGSGIYAHDSFFKATVSIGTDICILFFFVPLFFYTYRKYRNRQTKASELQLASVYALALYYAASMAFGVVYNQLFLVYIILFACSLFGMFQHIVTMKWSAAAKISRGMEIFFIVSGVALFAAWLPDIIISLIQKEPLSIIGVYTTEITYVLDMGIISPLCFTCLYLMKKQNSLGTILAAILLKVSMVIGIMMITQTGFLLFAGVNLTVAEIIFKSVSFAILAFFAYYFNRKIYKEVA